MSSILMASGHFSEYHAESLIMSVCMPKYGNLGNDTAKHLFIDDWIKSRQGIRSGLTADEFSKIINNANGNYFLIHKGLMEAICLKQDKYCWSDSTPANIYFLEQILTAFPKCKIINMIRDGRDVAMSLKKLGWVSMPFKTDNNVLSLWWAALQWAECASIGLKYSNGKYKDRIINIHYENLIENTRSELEKISIFLDLDLVKLLDQTGNIKLKESNTAYGDKVTGLSSASIGRWKTELTEKEVIAIEKAGFKELNRCSYHPEFAEKPTIPELIMILMVRS